MCSNHVFIGEAGALKNSLHQALDYVRFRLPHNQVIIKPNLVQPFRSGTGNITDRKVVKALIDVLLERHAIRKIIIAESSCITQDTVEAFERSGYSALQGYKSMVSLVDLKQEVYGERRGYLRKPHILHGKTLINVPVLKGHPQVTLTCALKNLKGLCCDEDKKMIHAQGLQDKLRHLEEIVPDLNLVDATRCRSSFGPKDVSFLNRIIVGKDPLLVDAVAARMVGLDIEDIPYLAEIFHAGNRQPRVNIDIPVLAHWQPFVDSVSFPGADIYLGDSCNHCIDPAVQFAGMSEAHGTRSRRIYLKATRILTRMVQKPARKDPKISNGRKPVIVIGRLASGVTLPRNRPVIYMGNCAMENPHDKGFLRPGCPPSFEGLENIVS